MKREHIDFSRVPPEQMAIHDRLINWARWCRPRWGTHVHPMFQWAISHARAKEDRDVPRPVNELDAQAIQAAYASLEGRKRRALAWCYVTQGHVQGAMRICGVSSKDALLSLICESRAEIEKRC